MAKQVVKLFRKQHPDPSYVKKVFQYVREDLTTLLSDLLAMKEKNKQYEDADLIKRVSPVAWQHINLRERYQFS